MAAKDIIGKGKQFSSTYQPARKGGRKPNILKKLKAVGLSHDDIRAILENLIMADKKKAQELLADPELPLMAVGYLSAMLKDIQKGHSITLEAIMDRLDGKAAQKVQAETTIKSATPPAIYFGEEETTDPDKQEE